MVLNPCPFCGHPAKVWHHDDPEYHHGIEHEAEPDHGYVFVACTNIAKCGCLTQSYQYLDSNRHSAEEHAVEIWNRRV